MKLNRLVPAIGLGMVVCAVAAAGEQGKKEKLRLVSVADSPDPFSQPVAGELAIDAVFEARPTDAGGGKAKNE